MIFRGGPCSDVALVSGNQKLPPKCLLLSWPRFPVQRARQRLSLADLLHVYLTSFEDRADWQLRLPPRLARITFATIGYPAARSESIASWAARARNPPSVQVLHGSAPGINQRSREPERPFDRTS